MAYTNTADVCQEVHVVSFYEPRIKDEDDDDDRNPMFTLSVSVLSKQGSHGSHPWPCALVLTRFIWHHREKFLGQRILELGCGVGLPGLLASKVGATVTFTDMRSSQDKTDNFINTSEVLQNVGTSAKLNKLDVQIQGLNWGDALTDVQDVDVVLGADVFYERENFEALVATLALLMRRSKSSCRAIIAYQERSSRRSIQELLDRFGLCARGIAKERFGVEEDRYGRESRSGEGVEIDGDEGQVWENGVESVFLFIVKLKATT